MRIEQSMQPIQGQHDALLEESFRRAPILHSLVGIEKFTETVCQSLQRPHAKTALFLFGEPGAGKQVIAGQLLDSLLHPVQPESATPLPQNTKIGYVSFGMAMKIARDPLLSQQYGEQQVACTDGNYTQAEYATASRIMNQLIEKFYATDPDQPHLLIAEAVGFTYPTYDHAGSVIQQQQAAAHVSPERDVVLLGIVAHDRVQDLAYVSRRLAANQAVPEEITDSFSRQRIVFDQAVFTTARDVDLFAKTRGNDVARKKSRTAINNEAWNRRRLLHLVSSTISREPTRKDLFGTQRRRRQTHAAYFTYMAENDFHVDPQKTLITENPPFRKRSYKIPYYHALTKKYALVS